MARQRDYKAEYDRRVARGLAAGLSRSQARGHPSAVKREPLVTQLPKERRPAPTPRPKVARPPRPQTPTQKLRGAKHGARNTKVTKTNKSGTKETPAVKFKGKRASNLEGTIDRIAHTQADAHVMINVRDKDGNWHTIYQKGGRDAASLADAINTSGQSAAEWLRSELGNVYESDDNGEDLWGDADIEWELVAVA